MILHHFSSVATFQMVLFNQRRNVTAAGNPICSPVKGISSTILVLEVCKPLMNQHLVGVSRDTHIQSNYSMVAVKFGTD